VHAVNTSPAYLFRKVSDPAERPTAGLLEATRSIPEQLYGLHLENVVQLSQRASARIARHDTALRNMAILGTQKNVDVVGHALQTVRAQDMDFGAIRGEIEAHLGALADPVDQRHKQCGLPAGACRGDRGFLHPIFGNGCAHAGSSQGSDPETVQALRAYIDQHLIYPRVDACHIFDLQAPRRMRAKSSTARRLRRKLCEQHAAAMATHAHRGAVPKGAADCMGRP
jgi:hypothetical protein